MITFKTAQEKLDFETNPTVKEKLKNILVRLDAFCTATNIPGPIVTDILRDDPRSQHSRGEAFDMRLVDVNGDGSRSPRYTLEEFAKILDFLETHFPRLDRIGNRFARVAYAHREGDNFHLHVSIDKEG